VSGLKSARAGLDKNLRKALKAEEFPAITFTLSSYKAGKDEVTATGELFIAGAKKTVELTGALKMEGGRLLVDGEKPLLMSEYGIKPPSLMLGAVKVADRIVVKFHLNIESDAVGKETK
jgi:polyisoprenoid-binding protein YceI